MTRRRLRTLVILLPAILSVGQATGADVDLVLTVEQLSGGAVQWELSAAARSAADNDGIAGLNVDLFGINSAHHTSPLVSVYPNFMSPTAGFTVGGMDFVNNGTVFAAQNSFVAGSQIYGVGEPGAAPPQFGPGLFVRNIPWDYPVTLATGTAASLLGPTFGQSANMTVWSQGQAAVNGVQAEFAQVFPSIVRIPYGVNEWIVPGSGSWNTPTNWGAGVVPNRVDAQVKFGDAISSPATVAVNSNVTVGSIVFDRTVPYTIFSPNLAPITLGGTATVNVSAGSHTIASPIAGTSGLTKSGPGTLTLSGANTFSGDTHVSAGTLIVQNQELPGESIDVAAGATLRLKQFVNYQLAPGQTLSGSGNVILEHSFSTSDLVVAPTAAIRGSLNIQADNVINSGRVAPGFSPGIIKIDGDYTQENDGVLEIEVGGLTPGTDHDQLQVTGSASLGGRLDLPLINGFVPTAGTEIQFLVADSIDGQFDSVFSPNLTSVAPGLSLDVSESEGRVRFVGIAPPDAIQFIAQAEVTPWIGEGTWTNNETPGTVHPITIRNQIGIPQRVEVSGNSAFTYQLKVEGGDAPITVAVDGGLSLSAIAGVTVLNRGIIELNGARLVSASTNIQAGGRLSGNGTVVGDLIVGDSSGGQPAVISPGLSVGHLEVEGNYQQNSGGTLVVEVEGTDAGQFDTLEVRGQAQLGGVLQIMVGDGAQIQRGDTIDILTAGSLTPDAVFQRIETLGVSDLYFALDYPNTDLPAGRVQQEGTSASGTFQFHGDLNRDGLVDEMDIPLFALGLRNREGFFGARPDGFCLCIEADEAADMDDNGRLDFDDIDDFAMTLEMGGMAGALAAVQFAVLQAPEPGSFALVLLGALSWGGLKPRIRKL